MTIDAVSFLTLALTIAVHLVGTAWWAGSVTRRIEHVERWIVQHEKTAERLAALEQRIGNLNDSLQRIEHFLRQKY